MFERVERFVIDANSTCRNGMKTVIGAQLVQFCGQRTVGEIITVLARGPSPLPLTCQLVRQHPAEFARQVSLVVSGCSRPSLAFRPNQVKSCLSGTAHI
jgi:hypothetical protein